MAEVAATPNSGAPQAQSTTTEPAAPTTAASTAQPAAPAAAAPSPATETAAAERRDYTARLASLTQKERLLNQRAEKARADLQAEREAVEAKRQEIAEAIEFQRQVRDLKELARRDPLKALEVTGLSYEQLTQYILNNGQPDPVTAVKSELADWKKQQEAERKAAQEERQKAVAAQQARQLQQWQAGVVNFVKTNPEYELIHAYDQYALVPQVIEEHYRQTEAAGLPVLLTEKEAADRVEAWLLDQTERAAKTKKMQERLKPAAPAAPAPAATASEPAQPQPAATAQPRTISEIPAASPTMPFVPRMNDDRIARAAAAMDRVRSSRPTS